VLKLKDEKTLQKTIPNKQNRVRNMNNLVGSK
jgi:hypothetical protein